MENCSPMGRIHGGVHDGPSPVGGSLYWTRGRVRRERSDSTTCNGLTTTLFPIPPQCWGGGGREFRKNVEPSKKESMAGVGGFGQGEGRYFKF